MGLNVYCQGWIQCVAMSIGESRITTKVMGKTDKTIIHQQRIQDYGNGGAGICSVLNVAHSCMCARCLFLLFEAFQHCSR